MLNWLKKNSFKIITLVVVVIVIFLINLYLQMTKPVPKVKVQKENEITVNSLVLSLNFAKIFPPPLSSLIIP